MGNVLSEEADSVFFHFDLEQYVENQGSYMDLKQELFGDVSYSASELVDKLSMYIENGFQEKKKNSAQYDMTTSNTSIITIALEFIVRLSRGKMNLLSRILFSFA
ncbi:hypothetical protein GCM10020331_024190 [Ectobacillus funiculus]